MILERLRRGERLRHYETVRLRKDGIASRRVADDLADPERVGRDHRCLEDRARHHRGTADPSRIRNCRPNWCTSRALSTMGQMASAIAHELNQPLTAVGNYAGALGRLLAERRMRIRTARATSSIGSASRPTRAGEVIRRLRDHVAKRNTMRRREDVNAVVREAVELGLVGTQHQGVQRPSMLDPAVGSALLDRIQIGQVIDQSGAQRGGGDGGRATARADVSTHALTAAVEIAVADTGPGIRAGGGGAAVPAVRHVEGRRASGWGCRSAASWSRRMAVSCPYPMARSVGQRLRYGCRQGRREATIRLESRPAVPSP